MPAAMWNGEKVVPVAKGCRIMVDIDFTHAGVS
jgi:hypothetical protein